MSGMHALVLDREPPAGPAHRRSGSRRRRTRSRSPAQNSASPFTNPGAGTMNPPSPWIGSMITRGDVLLADVLVHLVDRVGERLLRAVLRAARPPVRVGERQPVDLRHERAHALLVRHHLRGERHRHQGPAVERVVERDDGAAVPWPVRAILIAFSTASAPEFANIVLAGPSIGASRVQPLGELDVGLVGASRGSRCGCRARAGALAAATTSGAVCPTFNTEIPVARSISRLPSTSSTIAPEARAVTIGWRLETPAGTASARRSNHSRTLRAGDLGDDLAFLRDVHRRVLLGTRCRAGRGDPGPGAILSPCSRPRAARDGPERRSALYGLAHPNARAPPGPGRRSVRSVQCRAMAVTVRDIVSIPGMPLRLLSGEAQTSRPVRWVHVSELEDPTPWLKGGELILTTGMGSEPRRPGSART